MASLQCGAGAASRRKAGERLRSRREGRQLRR